MTFQEWLYYGIDNGFCSAEFCGTHDAPPMTDDEGLEFDEGGDPCMGMVRLGTPEDWFNK